MNNSIMDEDLDLFGESEKKNLEQPIEGEQPETLSSQLSEVLGFPSDPSILEKDNSEIVPDHVDEYDDDLMGDAEDRRALAAMSEMKREEVLAERAEIRDVAKKKVLLVRGFLDVLRAQWEREKSSQRRIGGKGRGQKRSLKKTGPPLKKRTVAKKKAPAKKSAAKKIADDSDDEDANDDEDNEEDEEDDEPAEMNDDSEEDSSEDSSEDS